MFQGHDECLSTKIPQGGREYKREGRNEWKLVCKKTLTAPKTNQADKEPTIKRTKWIINEKAKLLK